MSDRIAPSPVLMIERILRLMKSDAVSFASRRSSCPGNAARNCRPPRSHAAS